MSAVGALAGAAGGAWAAQRIAERGKKREQLLQELRNTNEAIDLAAGICTTYLGLKEQLVHGLRAEYDAQKAAVLLHQQGLDEGTIPAGTALDLGALDLKVLSNPLVPISRLEDVMSRVSVSGRPRMLVGVLAASIASLTEAIATWKQLVADFHAIGGPLDDRKIALVFGLRRGGVVDERYGDTVRALYDQTDYCIVFSKFLTSDLTKHGQRVSRDFKRRFGGELSVRKVFWHQAESKGLLPPEQDYASWSSSFPESVRQTYGRRLEKLHSAARNFWRRHIRVKPTSGGYPRW